MSIMIEKLKNQLENLDVKYNSDVDIISLKAFCSLPESEEINFAISGTLQKLLEKYPSDKEILKLLPEEEIDYQQISKYLEEKYSSDIETEIIKKLLTFEEKLNRNTAIEDNLKQLLKKYPHDNNIAKSLKIEKYIPEDPEENMVFVEEGKHRDIQILNLYVGKFPVIQDDWEKLMKNFPSFIEKHSGNPISNIAWIKALEYCNKLSEKNNFKPVYKIENGKLTKIIYKDGKEVLPSLADFSKTEGYRLPTCLEWEWFAEGGKKSTEWKIYSGSKYINEVGWHYKNSRDCIHAVGLKKSNELGLYDCTGNVWEWCYDTELTRGKENPKDKYYYYSDGNNHLIKGASFDTLDGDDRYSLCLIRNTKVAYLDKNKDIGFRVVRTAHL